MDASEAFDFAVRRNAESGHHYLIYRMLWTNEYLVTRRILPPVAPCYMVLIGEVRRMTSR